MVEINNQRKAFLDMLAWSEDDNGLTENPEICLVMTSLWAEAIYWLLRSPRKLVTLNPKPPMCRTLQLLSRWWDAYRKQLGLKDFSRKSRDAVALQQIKERGALWLIVVISVRQSTVAAISGLHCRALVMVSSSIRLTAWLQNSKKRAERSERLMYGGSHRDYLRSGYLHHRLLYRGLLIITVITPLPTKPSTTKMPENWSWRTRQLLTCRCVNGVCCLDAKYTKELADAKAENDALRDDVAAGRRRLHIKAVCQSVREAATASAWIMQPPPTGRHRWTGLFHLRGWSLAKTTGGTQKYINEQCR